ncbi:MAG: hypothetical protein KatS3mg129_2826 [Leptospiraceae bacterium]|nr:MAG: hypothetical protein KatS3mg129_2826 [Leptospiraceae bacterium]
MLIDTHCHIDITESFGLKIDEILTNCKEHHISAIVQIAVDKNSSLWNKNFVNQQKQNKTKIYYTMGLHPESVKNQDQINEVLNLIKENYKEDNFIGIGETGLDFFQTPETKDLQIESFYEAFSISKGIKPTCNNSL